MSRQRKDVSDAAPAGPDPPPPPSLLPAPSTGKPRRSAPARLARFLRTRPVTAAALLCAGLVCATLVFAVARVVHRLAAPAAPPLTGARVVAAGLDELRDDAGWVADGAREVLGGGAALVGGGVGAGAGAGAGAGLGLGLGLGARGERGVEHVGVEKGGCHRTLEDGFLGANGTLCVTDEFYFDIALGEEKLGRLVVGVFGRVVPKSAANFRALATCTGAFADAARCYRGDSFHRVVPDFVVQGGSKSTGRSIFGPTFREEAAPDHHSWLSHTEVGALSWAEYPIGSQFFVLTGRKSAYLDKNHVVFGVVVDGMDTLTKMANVPVEGDRPRTKISIIDCGDMHGAH